jgi:hypothetical protein
VKHFISSVLLAAATLSPAAFAAERNDVTEAEARDIAVEAYTYLYPLVTMDVSRRQMTNIEAGKMVGRGPMNQFSHVRAYPDANFREVVRPNFDTLYSSGWIDVSKEPIILSAPDTDGRYYLLPILDMWSDVVAAPGWRTSGTTAADFALVPPKWTGTLPAGVKRIDVTTPYLWVIGRTLTNGPADYAAVHKIQDGYKLTPLSQWGKTAAKTTTPFKVDPKVDMKTPPLEQVNAMTAAEFFTYAAELLKKHPPHTTDWSTIERLKRIGLESGKSFDASKQTANVQRGIANANVIALKNMQAKLPTLARVSNGWQMNTDSMGVYGNNYLKRALVAMVGLGANQADDAIYPLVIADAEGQPISGANAYVMHFSKEELPPVEAFWSLTMYDKDGFPVANPLNRFAIGSKDKLTYNQDGSLDLYIQNANPGKDKEANWLPAPKDGLLGLTMRLYAPRQSALDGRWNPPALTKAGAQSH